MQTENNSTECVANAMEKRDANDDNENNDEGNGSKKSLNKCLCIRSCVCVCMRKRVNILCMITNDGVECELQTPYIMFYRIVYNFISHKYGFWNEPKRFPANFVRELFLIFILVKPKCIRLAVRPWPCIVFELCNPIDDSSACEKIKEWNGKRTQRTDILNE